MAPNARITVRVQAVGGKFLADDIGGAILAVRDAQTGELLTHGTTSGTSGDLGLSYTPNASLAVVVTPATSSTSQVIRWLSAVNTGDRATNTSSFTVNLELDRPRLLEIEAFGPRGGLQSAHRVMATEWLAPGQDQTAAPGLVLMMPGLLVQVQSPATHTDVTSPTNRTLDLVANVAMMCGCPISDAPGNPWLPSDFDVSVAIRPFGSTAPPTPVTLNFDTKAGIPGRFTGQFPVPKGASTVFYEAVFTAIQKSTRNVGSATVTFFG